MSCSNGICKSKVVDYESLDADIQNLIIAGIEARKLAHCPFSKFAVGACIQCDDGSTYTGCNIENASYGLTCCAERTALFKAVSEGKKKFKAISVIAQQERGFTTPCGPCRQFLSEFNTEMVVYCCKPSLGQVMVSTIEELLPYSFKFDD